MTNPTERYTAEQMLWIANDLARVQSFDPMSAKWISKAHLALRQAASDVRDAERLNWLEKEYGSNLVNDDDCRWAVSNSGFQPVPEEGGFKDLVSIVCFVEPQEWFTNLREAIDTAMGERDE